MCGILGFCIGREATIRPAEIASGLATLFRLSESRGKESAGFLGYLPDSGEARTVRGNVPATILLASKDFRRSLSELLDLAYCKQEKQAAQPLAIIGHSRLVTNGTAAKQENNQPVQWGGTSVVHNGIVVNVDQVWASRPDLTRHAEVDTELIAALIDSYLDRGRNPAEATAEMFAQIRGSASIAWLNDRRPVMVLASNTGDLFCWTDPIRQFLIFASEAYIIRKAVAHEFSNSTQGVTRWIQSGQGLVIELEACVLTPFNLSGAVKSHATSVAKRPPHYSKAVVRNFAEAFDISTKPADESLLLYNEKSLRQLRRCTRCILPETFPFIEFDHHGVCNYCHGYRPKYKGVDPDQSRKEFLSLVEKYRREGDQPDVLVPFSGGRDSCYGLHLLKNEFGFKPITFTYDWGMVTDLARRNIARLCGVLGVQNILVSADIKRKRENIRRNVSAWLRKPDLGLVPLFMAGDKHFFKIVNQIKKQTSIQLNLWSANPLENTDFKAGFCGIAPDFNKSRIDYLSFGRKTSMALFYGFRFLSNPGYLNRSLFDTATAFASYYFEPRLDFFHIFHHLRWEEEEVNRIICSHYDFELAPDSPSTWRIGDGTAPFYNYIYVTARGFSEFDTFRSNQIREGMIGRDQALAAVLAENRPRAESLRWYLQVIGLDFDLTIRRINSLDTLGLHR